ncbi:MAG TPA: lysylphosphatidylglycerol synthase domain-containing protein [Polyangia bacterium]|nr:lysylphosphatidylglycerol synthase domain-containing protein [Polyangia bacterium]
MLRASEASAPLDGTMTLLPSATPEPGSRATWTRWLLSVLRFGMIALAVFAVFRMVTPADLGRARTLIVRVGWPLAFVLLPTLVAMSLDATGWRLIVVMLGNRVSWPRMLGIRLAVEALVLAMPGGSVAGEAAKAGLLTRAGGVPLARGTASLVLTKGYLFSTDAIYLAGAALWVVLAGAERQAPGLTRIAGIALCAAFGSAVVAVALFAVVGSASFATTVARHLRRLPSERWRRWLDQRREAVRALDAAGGGFFASSRALRVGAGIPFMLEWLVEGLETLIILRLLDVTLGLGHVFLLDGVGSFVRAAAFFVPAGVGVQDATMILLLRTFGIPDPFVTGSALIVVKRSKEVFWIVAGTLFFVSKKRLWKTSPGRAT